MQHLLARNANPNHYLIGCPKCDAKWVPHVVVLVTDRPAIADSPSVWRDTHPPPIRSLHLILSLIDMMTSFRKSVNFIKRN